MICCKILGHAGFAPHEENDHHEPKEGDEHEEEAERGQHLVVLNAARVDLNGPLENGVRALVVSRIGHHVGVDLVERGERDAVEHSQCDVG